MLVQLHGGDWKVQKGRAIVNTVQETKNIDNFYIDQEHKYYP